MDSIKHTHSLEEIDFQKYWLVLQRRWLSAVGIFGTVLTLSSVYAFSLKPYYQAQASLLIKTNRTSSLTGLGEDLGRLEALVSQSSPVDTQVKIVTSVPVLKETIKALDLRDSLGNTLRIEDLAAALSVVSVKGTDLLEIYYADSDPLMAAKVVNKLVEIYIKHNIQANRAEAVSARRFMREQLPKTEQAVKQAESNLRKFKEQNKVVVLQQEAAEAVSAISKLEDNIAAAQAQLVNVTAQSQKLKEQIEVESQKAITYAELSQIPGTQQLLTQLQKTQADLEVARTRFQPEHPDIVNLEQQVSALNKVLQQRVEQVAGKNQQVSLKNLQIGGVRQNLIQDLANTEKVRLGLEKQIADLNNTLFEYKQRANILPKLEETQRELERKVKAAQTTYENLLTRMQEVDVAENQNVGNATIISPALIPDKPSGPRKTLLIAAGGILGILLGVVAAFSLELVDQSVKTLKEAKELFQYTLLGVIPNLSRYGKTLTGRLDRPTPRVIGRDIHLFAIRDAYQMLQANLRFLSDKQLKAIAVTSSVAKEGKSEVSANLAVVMAQVGRRVLLVDADMRRPCQHHIWGLTNAQGLSNAIVDDQIPLNTVVQEVMPNLYVLPSGVIPPNPLALLDSQRMTALVTIFARSYDCVIFDTPPLAGTADVSVLGKLVDGLLLVVRPGVVNAANANAAKEFLTQSGQKVLGMVINGVNVKNEPDSYFYYTQESPESFSISQDSARVRQKREKGTGY
ncbi:MAG: polysaccharide biosynthesis tyrosine autokinase [Chlorogloeopsis fritschii C42_A2020_084]|uniref:GumC family protein n=1 Tax=Chlorogloeopsis fritschii TaxID=1124 RepID=UPI0019EB77AC|nr:polysaccharide biosynthesis tyrosine autokinase [Chlorogloeopsis fritschii]MBF2005397.1 polysaccharide biosynthesis tyrosine autokinase [Chlorogloeopsis fritschii C42_A2020_084]